MSAQSRPMFSDLRSLTAVAVAAAVAAFVVSAGGCGKKAPEAVIFKANSPIPVGFTLLKAEGQKGRSGAIGNNYRPQVRFPRGTIETTCAVALPASSPALEPGQTADASLACDYPIGPGRSSPARLCSGRPTRCTRVRSPESCRLREGAEGRTGRIPRSPSGLLEREMDACRRA